MTEFEELALKKITKDYLVDCVYTKINTIANQYGISNAEISKRIGWDPASFNQKYHRSNDLRISTFIKIYMALNELILQKEADCGLTIEQSYVSLNELITQNELNVGALFLHISAAAEGQTQFLQDKFFIEVYKSMKPFILVSKKNDKFSEREVEVYIKYYQVQ